jgi:hypothetical protein
VVGRGDEEGEGAEAFFDGAEVAVGPVGCAEVGRDAGVFGAEEVEEDEERYGT